MATKVRANQVKVGQMFKRSEVYSGTVTYKRTGRLFRSPMYKNEYLMECEVIACTDKKGFYYKQIGKKQLVTFTIRYNRLGLVTLVEKRKED